jgi:hypothetical protein
VHKPTAAEMSWFSVSAMVDVTVRINLGPEQELDDLADLVGKVSNLVALGAQMDERSRRNNVLMEMVSGAEDQLENPIWRAFVTEWFERTVTQDPRLLAELNDRVAPASGPVRVRSLSYSNPLEIALAVSGSIAGLVAILVVVRDWSAKRRIGQAKAVDYESSVKHRKRLREHVVNQVTSGQLTLTREQAEALLTPEALDALDALRNTPVELKVDGEEVP